MPRDGQSYMKNYPTQMTTGCTERHNTEASLRFWFLFSILILELSFLLRTYHKFQPVLYLVIWMCAYMYISPNSPLTLWSFHSAAAVGPNNFPQGSWEVNLGNRPSLRCGSWSLPASFVTMVRWDWRCVSPV